MVKKGEKLSEEEKERRRLAREAKKKAAETPVVSEFKAAAEPVVEKKFFMPTSEVRQLWKTGQYSLVALSELSGWTQQELVIFLYKK